jgi:hypothetical protein
MSFKKIKCFKDLEDGVEHWNGNSQHSNIYNKLTTDTVEIEHYYRYGKRQKPFIMNREEFDSWLASC